MGLLIFIQYVVLRLRRYLKGIHRRDGQSCARLHALVLPAVVGDECLAQQLVVTLLALHLLVGSLLVVAQRPAHVCLHLAVELLAVSLQLSLEALSFVVPVVNKRDRADYARRRVFDWFLINLVD